MVCTSSNESFVKTRENRFKNRNHLLQINYVKVSVVSDKSYGCYSHINSVLFCCCGIQYKINSIFASSQQVIMEALDFCNLSIPHK